MSKLVRKAAEFARVAHEGADQKRKYSAEPYIVHPEAVATTVASVTDDEVMIAAAWLHDVVEDTPVTLEQIAAEFGDDVAGLVDDLTNASKKSDGNRAKRKEIDRQHTAQADPRAKTVKLADLIDNLTGIATSDPGFAKTYLKEKELQLQVLTEGHPDLFRRVEEIIRNEKAVLAKRDD
ncbi:MAG: bifunctional (p)ppGpp synthetase/guanosine-3',5'-bis(diphosphate) 3'-pyrophosphohydrolase [Planctomycetaceae bacterium]|nr:bifunctional (p)ppGpp synthetase/guanosine-3',5'-bis(diphosphate) 3'-pyrophosphohydrolase [Planctomycetaceae bacterium]MCA9044779.1 bifunctional (p)ppGpp synthetase/guanosine-3',5'-bis(diphosphate) 3'-pyrophosphohydrolase [Planctomycetaceae bacterium]